MRQFNVSRGVKGLLSFAESHVRFTYMITPEAQRRVRILTFWSKYGLRATQDAFAVSRPTLFRWKKALATGVRLESLNPQSRKPRVFRTTKLRVQPGIETYVIQLRNRYPRLGKHKLKPLLDVYCHSAGLRLLSVASIGILIRSLKERKLLADGQRLKMHPSTGKIHLKRRTDRPKQRLAKGYRSALPGGLVQIDTVIQFIDGVRRYCITAVDTHTRFAFAYGYAHVSSATAADFLGKLLQVIPFPIAQVQTDNGSEFAKYFTTALLKAGIDHFHTYPHTPKMNAFVERFNRTIQYEFANFHRYDWQSDMNIFNQKLVTWLIWYNTQRVHQGLKYVTPINFLLAKSPESHMWVARTSTCKIYLAVL